MLIGRGTQRCCEPTWSAWATAPPRSYWTTLAISFRPWRRDSTTGLMRSTTTPEMFVANRATRLRLDRSRFSAKDSDTVSRVLPNLEYANFNRLLVTLGILSLALALVIPWLYLREIEVLLVPEAEIEQLSDDAQETIRDRQAFHRDAQRWWAVPIALAVVGIGLLSAGGVRMYKRQRADDERADLERDRLALDIGQQSDDEREATAELEADAALRDLTSQGDSEYSGSDISVLANRIRQLVDSTAEAVRVAGALSESAIMKGVRLGSSGSPVDIVVERDGTAPDVLIETSLLLQPRTADVRTAVSTLGEALARYSALAPSRDVRGMLVLALPDEGAQDATIDRIAKTAHDLLGQRRLDESVSLIVASESGIHSAVSELGSL